LGKPWSAREIQLLKKYYPILSKRALISIFPNRTYQALSRIASKLGIKKSIDFKRGPSKNIYFVELVLDVIFLPSEV
jgi:hypothetical protein